VEVGYRTPLLDFFRRGEVARDVRLLAAQGGLAPRAHEQIGLLMLLVDDQDPEVASTAEGTLQAIPSASLSAFIARADVSSEMREFFARRGIEPADIPAADTDEPIVDAAPAEADGETGEAGETGETDEERHQNTLQKIASLNVAQRVALAMKGSREERAILIRDPNKIVAVGVLSSPKMTDSEAESIAKMANVSDEILRIIAFTRAWVKNYGVVLALAKNPKTPVAVSMNLLSRLNEKDLRILSTDRNVPDVLRVTARKKLVVDK
jgi:hypothetical protein